jgi:hypothetical protein
VSDLNKLSIGQRIDKFPARTFNTLVQGELRDRQHTGRSPTQLRAMPSPFTARLVWNGAAAIAPGSTVRLGDAIYDPDADPTAPFTGLAFHAFEFDGEALDRYAITLGPVEPDGTCLGVLPSAQWARVDVGTESDSYATASGSLLTSHASRGIPILWKPAGTGVKWAVVSLTTERFQLIRGTTVAAVTPLIAAFQLSSIATFEEQARAPQSPVWVAAPPGGVTLNLGDSVWAAYHKDFTTFDHDSDPETDPVSVDWVMIPTGEGESSPPLRRFELTTGKFSSTTNVAVNWLDNDGNTAGDLGIVYDPDQLFAGQAADYVSGEAAFRGEALLRADLAESDPDAPRWEIDNMEGFARWITAVREEGISGDPDERKQALWFRFTGVYTSRDQWHRKPPAAVGDPIRWHDDIENALVEPIVGDTVLMMLVDSDGLETPADGWTWQPQYVPVAVFDRTAIVQVRSISGGDPAGYAVAKTGDCFPGKRANTVGVNPIDADATANCWITDLSGSTTLSNKSFHLGRFVGLYDPDPEGTSDERPRFAIERVVGRMVRGTTTALVSAFAGDFQLTSLNPIFGDAPPDPLTVLQTFPVGYALGESVLVMETSAGTWINFPYYGRVLNDSADVLPEFHWNKITDHSTYNGADHQIVYAQAMDVGAGVRRTKLFTDKGGGSGGGCTAIVDEDIAAATRSGDGFTPTIVALNYLVKSGGNYIVAEDSGTPLERNFEWHDVNEGFTVESGLKYHALTTLTDDGIYRIDTIIPCAAYNAGD